MDETDRAPLEDLAENNNLNTNSKRRIIDSYSLRFYLHIAPSIIFPFAMGVSDGISNPIVPFEVRQGIYAVGIVLHLGKYQCPPAYSPASEKLLGGVIFTVGSYWLGRGIGAIGSLVDKLT